MKKDYIKIVLLNLSLYVGVATAAVEFKDRSAAMQYLVSIHNRVFGMDNLFKQKINTNDWYNLTDALEKYIEDNSKSYLIGGITGLKDSSLMTALNQIDKVNTQFISVMQILWNSYFSRISQVSTSDYNKMKNEVAKLRPLINTLAQIQKNSELIKITKDKKFEPKQDGVAVLLNWALVLQVTMEKAIRDFDIRNAEDFIQNKK